MNMKETPAEIKQSLLELHYDLLDDSEAQQWRQRIATDPDVASAWAETLRLAGKMANAAKIQGVALPKMDKDAIKSSADNNIESQEPGSARFQSVELASKVEQAEPTLQPAPARISKRWWAISVGMLATTAATGLMIVGLRFQKQAPSRPAPALQLHANANSNANAESDSGVLAANEFEFVTNQITEAKSSGVGSLPVVPAVLNFSVLFGDNKLYSGTAESGDDGRTRVALPPELVIPSGAELHVHAEAIDGVSQSATVTIPLEPTRCLTYLTVDRPVYRPGESVFFRSLTLNRRSLSSQLDVPVRFELIDPSGAAVPGAFTEGVTDRGVGNGSFQIPSAAPGGQYTLIAKSLDGFFPDEQVKFNVRVYRVPRFKKQLEFRRRSYGPGETVEADFSAERAEGGPLAGVVARVAAKVDGVVVHQQKVMTTASGTLSIAFKLPDFINVGQAELSVAVDDGGTVESKTKTIPIQLGNVDIKFYPEGGYLVGGLENRVYFTARNTQGQPIEIKGEIISSSGVQLASIETTRDGMGRFEFRPNPAESYFVKVTEPVDVINTPELPPVVKDLPVIDTGDGVFGASEPISLTIRSRKRMPILVQAVCRGQLVGQQELQASRDAIVTLPIRDDASGVIRVTVLDTSTKPPMPLVERLVFRRDNKRLNVNVLENPSSLQRSPGDPMRLTLQVTDENDQPMPAVLGVSVVDDASLSLAENEEPTLRTHFLVTSEIEKPEDLEHANFYLSEGDDAAESLDLLLGTQGWRRFVSGSPDQPDTDFRQQLVRLLKLDGERKDGAPTYSSQDIFSSDWSRYQSRLGRAWSQLFNETRFVLLIVIGFWSFVVICKLVLIRIRRQPMIDVGVLLVLGSMSVAMLGCGVKEAANVALDAASKQKTSSHDRSADMKGSGQEMAPNSTGPRNGGIPDMENPSDNTTADFARQAIEDSEIDSNRGSIADGFVDQKTGKKLTPAQLKRLLTARGLDAETLADQLMKELRFPIRQYAHQHKKSDTGVRQDFAETLYWQPLVITDSSGKATIRFDLSDSVTSFRVRVDGHTKTGRIGSGSADVISKIPFQLEPKMPLEVTTGDVIDLPVAVVNTTADAIGIQAKIETAAALRPEGKPELLWSVDAEQRTRQYIRIKVAEDSSEQDAMIQIQGTSDGENKLRDKIRRTVHIKPAGYPISESVAGVLNKREKITLPVASKIVPGSLSVTLRAYPSPLSDVMSGVESILREPHGCFEQTSATNYPNAMALSYMRRNKIANPNITKKARGMLDRGYGKLTSFECTKRGYEWFGNDPGHEALSAFGLMQFTDMKKIMQVDDVMVRRTRVWLMGRRDGKGSFQRNPRHLHVWLVKQSIVNAYVLWAISEADVAANMAQRTASELGPELDELNRAAKASNDAYLIALSAATLMNAKRSVDANRLLSKLVGLQADDGSVDGETTVTSSGGISRKVETTALAAIAWMKSASHLNRARDACKWLTSNRQGTAGFGSTQATVLALKALVGIAEHSSSQSGGNLRILIDGTEVAKTKLPSDPRGGETVEIVGLGDHFDIGDVGGEQPKLELIAKRATGLSYTIDMSYNAIEPNSHPDCPIQIKTQLSGEIKDEKSVAAGKTMTVNTTVTNVTNQGKPMTVAIVGLPGGLEPNTEQLNELMKTGKCDFYELRGREVIFYWRTFEPNAEKKIDFTVTAEIPGTYTGPASRAYLYYTAEQKHWTEPLQIKIRK